MLQFYFLSVHFKYGCNGMFQAVDWLAILARGLYVETVSTVTSARTVLAEQKPQVRIIERWLALCWRRFSD